ncbi:MAG: phytanoyl-CoA dioxygenase family protein [Candidatus Poribacteria bacterium]|nr:phytanoyl-CoA dioxygenase family protein [Candidatus Poribacteria bacterium]
MKNSGYKLDIEEMNQFRKQGYLGPYTLCSPEEMLDIQPEIEKILETDAPERKSNSRVHNRHLDFPLVYNLATHPSILERMTSLYGPDLLLWRTRFFVKEPGAKEIPWHQDFNTLPIEPPIIISAWIAVDSVTQENSCLQIVPGSHRKVIPHVKATPEMAFGHMCDPNFIDPNNYVNLEMQPGEFVLFNERTLHHSEANRSNKRRIGLAVRVILPIVKIFRWDSPEHKTIVIHGEDRVNFNARS